MQFLAAGIAQRAAGQNMMMRVANVAKQLRLLGTRKEVLRIGAKKREAVMRGKAVPEFLESQRGIAESLLAENRDHLSERMQWLSALRGLGDTAPTVEIKRASSGQPSTMKRSSV